MKKLIYIIAIIPQLFFAQVGIGTVTPEETLHIEGTLRVTNTKSTTPTKITGFDANGTMSEITVGDNLELNGNTLNVVLPSTANTNTTNYGIATINVADGTPNQKFNNLNIDLNGANANTVLFKLEGRTKNYTITGIEGGTHGKHIILFNVSTSNLTFNNEDNNSDAQNRIITLDNNINTSGQGTAEFVYDGGLQRWILINFRN